MVFDRRLHAPKGGIHRSGVYAHEMGTAHTDHSDPCPATRTHRLDVFTLVRSRLRVGVKDRVLRRHSRAKAIGTSFARCGTTLIGKFSICERAVGSLA